MAIAFGTATKTGQASAASVTMAHTAVSSTGGTALFAGVAISVANTATATYNAVTMTVVDTASANAAASTVVLFYTPNAASGSHNLVVTFGSNTSCDVWASDYKDTAAAGSGIDTHNTFSSTTTTDSETLTPTTTGNWMIACVGGQGADATATTNCTKRTATASTQRNCNAFDSDANGLTASSAFTMTQTSGAADANMAAAIFSIENSTPTVSKLRILTTTGAGK